MKILGHVPGTKPSSFILHPSSFCAAPLSGLLSRSLELEPASMLPRERLSTGCETIRYDETSWLAVREGTEEDCLATGEGRRGAPIGKTESWQKTQRSGGLRGQGLPRFTSQLLSWLSRSENPHPGSSALNASELIHSTQDCALQSRPSPAGRGWCSVSHNGSTRRHRRSATPRNPATQ